MTVATSAAAGSHVGKIRSNNQDSGYTGRRLFVVADGMGGHAGGDVASAIAVKHIRDMDHHFETIEEARVALEESLIGANAELSQTVYEHSELAGMGTTVSALIRVGDQFALAHIGDSRVYLYRHGDLRQITADHTFVQRLVESGRITPEEALTHPRRSVLMRVLGDVEARPEIDTAVYDLEPGDRWLICSDGLSSYVTDEETHDLLAAALTPAQAVEQLIAQSLDAGAPDNVTVIVVDVTDPEHAPANAPIPLTVGSAAAPLAFETTGARRVFRIPTVALRHPIRVIATEQAHFEPASEEYLEQLIAEDHRRARLRRLRWLFILLLVLAIGALAAFLGYRWTQTLFYVGVDQGQVAIYQGVNQSIGSFELSHVYETTEMQVDSLPEFYQQKVTDTISAGSLDEARDIVDRIPYVGG